MKFCIFDGDQSLLHLVTLLLEKAGHEVSASTRGEQALGIATTNQPDALITDRMMPDIDGLSLVHKLRGRKEFDDMIIIMMSVDSGTDRPWRREAEAAGADGFIAKPFDPSTFAAEVEAIVNAVRSKS